MFSPPFVMPLSTLHADLPTPDKRKSGDSIKSSEITIFNKIRFSLVAVCPSGSHKNFSLTIFFPIKITAQAHGSDTEEDSEDNNEPMQAGILDANDKSEEAPSDRDDELQGATAAFDASGSAEESTSAVEQVVSDSCSSLDQVLQELELIRRSVVQGQQPRRECEVQPQQQPQPQQLALPTCPQQLVS